MRGQSNSSKGVSTSKSGTGHSNLSSHNLNRSNSHSNGNGNHRRSNSRTGHTGSANDGKTTKQTEISAWQEKLLYIVAKSIGKKCVATVSSGCRFLGVLISADLGTQGGQVGSSISIILQYPRVVSKALINEKTNIDKDEEMPERLIIQAKDLMDFEVPIVIPPDSGKQAPAKVPATPANDTPEHSSFKTDVDISGNKEINERELKRWVPDEDTVEISLEEELEGTEGWDQFKVNQEKFGVQPSYDEHLYTTRINTSAPDYEARLKEAERIAKEIENQTTSDRHVLEERGVQIDDSGVDEEDKYSGVDRRGDELMAALRNTNLSADENQKDKKEGNRFANARQNAARYHNDPAIISSSAMRPSSNGENASSTISNAEVAPVVQASPDSKQQDVIQSFKTNETFRLNAQSEINSLREFSANFKIPHKLPSDLLPILAKDKIKQDEILRKKEKPENSSRNFDKNDSSRQGSPAPQAKITNDLQKSPQRKKMDPSRPAFKLNPKAAAFTPSIKPQQSPSIAKASFQQSVSSPRIGSQRTHTSGSGSSASGAASKRHHQVSPAEFFGGADRVPTRETQEKKVKQWKDSFNLFITVERKALEKNVAIFFEKTFHTPPTWESTIDELHDSLFPSPDSLKGPSPLVQNSYAFIPSPMIASPNLSVPGSYSGMSVSQAGNKFAMSPQQQQVAALAHFQQQQFHAAMMYQQQFGGVAPGQSPLPMYGQGSDAPFVPTAGFVVPPAGFVNAGSPVNGNMMMVGSPFNGSSNLGSTHHNHHNNYNSQNNYSRRYNGSHHHHHHHQNNKRPN